MNSSRHLRTGNGISWLALILGVALGIAGGLVYTWEIDPVIERNTAPWQLSDQGREDYIVAVALSYAYNHDLEAAFNRLRALRPDQDVWSLVAQTACDRVKQGKTVTNSDIRVIRAMEQLYRPQGASGCGDGLYPTPAPVNFATSIPTVTLTPTLTPPATKTPTPQLPTNTPVRPVIPTATPISGGYSVTRVQSFCDADHSGVIEVRVYDRLGRGTPGVQVTVTWSGNVKESFFTGLKPEREAGYADYAMTAGRSYAVTVADLVGSPPVVEAAPCDTADDGSVVLTSYWVNFQQRGG